MPTPLATRPAVVRAVAASAALTLAWGLVSGITQYHFAYACLAVGLVLSRTLTRPPAPRSALLPAIAAVLAFAVGFLGDYVAVGVALWLHYNVPAGIIVDHASELFRNVADGHSIMDWAFFLLAAVASAGLTAGRQLNSPGAGAGTHIEASPVQDEAAS
jgi:hypothetical protein